MQAFRLPWTALARPPVPMLDVELVIDFLPLFAPKTEFQTEYFFVLRSRFRQDRRAASRTWAADSAQPPADANSAPAAAPSSAATTPLQAPSTNTPTRLRTTTFGSKCACS